MYIAIAARYSQQRSPTAKFSKSLLRAKVPKIGIKANPADDVGRLLCVVGVFLLAVFGVLVHSRAQLSGWDK